MKWNDVFCDSFKKLRKQIEPIVKKQVDMMLPSVPMMKVCRADDFDFFHPWLDSGDLTKEQMCHACERYYLGKTKSGLPMFWMIDDLLQPLDAHIGDTWISHLLKKREPLLRYWQVTHCLFGLHLLCHTDLTDSTEIISNSQILDSEKKDSCNSYNSWQGRTSAVCVVEREEAAVVLSELFPESIWMAYATTFHLNPELFAPLEGRTVIIYPRTDPCFNTFLFFEDLIDSVQRQYDIHISLDATLENYATSAQKERCIDLLDFLFEAHADSS